MGPQTPSRWSYGFAPGMILLSASVAFVLVMGGGSALALGGFFPETFCTADPCLGTDGVDLLGGTAEAETIDVLAGDDFVNAWRGGDAVYGREGNDELDGHYGNDTIYGGPGNDLLYGAAHSDTVYGGTGEDRIRAEGFDSEGIGANPPVDRSYGQGGNDRIVAFDGYRDVIDAADADVPAALARPRPPSPARPPSPHPP